MARTSLPPGFRFHPTDVELIMYYLKRKILGKKLRAEAIADVNIYKFSPWDLPDKSCLRSKDLEWFFFCPRERKYASGARVKRATENGYWKTTGKDRSISYDDKHVGTVKTLIFHLGHAPRGERTDWVIHEYKILDDQLADAGIQASYVLCKVFKKNGLGPKNGAQYGAPFKEEEWTDDETDDAQDIANTSSVPVGQPPDLLSEKQTEVSTSLFDQRNTSEVSLNDEHPSPSAGARTGGVHLNISDEEMDRLLAPFLPDNMFPLNENGIHEVDDNGNLVSTSVPCLGGNDIFGGLQDLHDYVPVDGRLGFTGTLNDDYSKISAQGDFLELDDLQVPLNYHHELDDIFGPFSSENAPNLFSAIGSSGTGQYASCETMLDIDKENYGLNVNNNPFYQNLEISNSQLPLMANGSYKQNYSLDTLQMVNNNQFYPEIGAAFDLGFSQRRSELGESSGRFDDTW